MKVGIVGSGFVGSTAAYAMVMDGIGREIIMVDLDRERAEAEANDIMHAVPFAHPLQVRAGDYEDLAGSRVVIIAAGVSQKSGETRLQLLDRNAGVFREVVPRILRQAPEAVLLVATNPVDIMTHLAAEFAAEFEVPPTRVIGSGTTLDTARFRTLLGRHFGVDSRHVHAYVIGEHGDSEVLTWSIATIGGVRLQRFAEMREIAFTEETMQGIDRNVRQAAYQIISGKGATYYGVGAALARIVDSIIHDQRSILTVCCRTDDTLGATGVTISLPRLLGGQGILGTTPISIERHELEAFQQSARVIRDAIESIGSTRGAAGR